MDAMFVDGQIIRLYQAFFAREPDQEGFTFWSNALSNQGFSLSRVAQSFSGSEEFIDTYGSLDNDQFIELVYQNVLGREPDASGFAYWQGAMSSGLTRGKLMVGFSESEEHIQNTKISTYWSHQSLEKPVSSDLVFQQYEEISLITGDGITNSSAVIAMDVNGDGLLDLLSGKTTPVLQDAKLPLELLLNQGGRQFQLADLSAFISGPVPALQNTTELLKADLNGDGIDDLVLAGRGVSAEGHAGERNQLLLSDGVSQWRNAEMNLPDDVSLTHSISAGDIDKDGDLDLLVGNVSAYEKPYLLLNDGEGNFTRDDTLLPEQLETKNQIAVHLADINNDGAADLIIGADDTADGYVVLSDGMGSFNGQTTMSLPVPDLNANDMTLDIESYDVNGDGWLDLLVSHTQSIEGADYEGNTIQVMINQQGEYFIDESFRIPEQSASGLTITDLFVADLNGDGYIDLLAEQTGDYFLNDGRGSFSTHGVIAQYKEGDGPFVLADLDNDQQLELIVVGVVAADLYQ